MAEKVPPARPYAKAVFEIARERGSFAFLIGIVITLVLFLVGVAIHYALFGQEQAPEVIAVTGEQGVVEIKYR